jgi:DNA polymerase I
MTMTSPSAVAIAKSKKKLPQIQSTRPEVDNSASIDLEWRRYNGKYDHSKTEIYAASFCTNLGRRIVLHISKYVTTNNPEPEKALIQDILLYLNQFPLTFGWYTTGITVYDDKAGLRVRGRDSDFFYLTSEVYIPWFKFTY